MGTRSRLFASAAFPLLSLSLMLQPAHAALLVAENANATVRPVDATPSYQVAQAAPEPGDDDQDPKKKKKPAEASGTEPAKAEKPAAEPEAPKQPKAEKPAEPEAPRPPKAEKPAEAEAPKPAKPAAEPEAAPVKPKAVAPEAAPAAPKAAAEPEAPKPPKPPKAEKPAAAEEPESAPVKPKAAVAAEPEAQPETKKPHKPTAEEPAAPAVKPKAEAPATAPAAETAAPAAEAPQPPKKHQKPAAANGETAPAAEPATPGEKPAKPQQPAEQVVPNAEKPAEPKEGAKPAKPAGDQAPAAADQKSAAPASEEPTAPASGKAAPDAGSAPAKEAAPAQNGAAAPTTAGQQVSPAELEKRQKIADNPAAAGAGSGPVILPVQNGTAVLDSDKDAARQGHRGQPAPGGRPSVAGQPQAGGQAQAPDGQRPPAPADVRAPTSDADSQRAAGGKQAPPVKIQAVTSEQGQRMDKRPDFAAPDGARMGDRQDNRVIINFGDDEFVRHDDTQRFTRDGERPTYEQLPRDRYRETIDRPDGNRIITVRNRYGDIIQRSRIDARGREYVLFYSPELEQTPDQDDYYRDPGDALPPMRLRIPLNQYIIDTSEDQDQDYYDFLRKPPVEPVERVYSLNEVRYSARLRDKVRRIDLDTITFATGSAEVPMAQAKTLRGIADAIGNIVKKDPTETFLIEGHTDAVGTDQSNLILSDQRAESVANVLTDVYGIPPENLATQGYGEQYLKINTDGPQQENRRVTIRRVTALVRPVAAK
ncbi:MAG: OmpA family protein [Rhizobium sp.]